MSPKQKSRCFTMSVNNVFNLKNHKYKEKQKNKRQRSQSMLVLVWVQVLATITALFSFWLTVKTQDPSVLMVLIPAVFVDASAVTALVLWKRKNERIFSFFSDEKMRESFEWFLAHNVDPVDFFRAFKE